jgi:hypothetical protein
VHLGGKNHKLSLKRVGNELDFWLCSDHCGELIAKAEAMIAHLPASHPARQELEHFIERARQEAARIAVATTEDEAEKILDDLREHLEDIESRHPGAVDADLPPAEPAAHGRRVYVPPPAPRAKMPVSPAPPTAPAPPAAPAGKRGQRHFGPDPTTARPTGPASIEDADILSQRGAYKQTRAYPGQHQHHVFPQEMRDWFKAKGVTIDEYTVFISEGEHQAIHLKKNFKGWNQEWKDFIDTHPNATEQQVFEEAGRLMDKYRISDAEIAPYGQKK